MSLHLATLAVRQLEAIQSIDGLPRLGFRYPNSELGRQSPGGGVDGIPDLRCQRALRQAVGAVGNQLWIRTQRTTDRTESQIEAHAVHRRADDPQRLHPDLAKLLGCVL